MSGMTGEAMPVERRAGVSSAKETALNHDNICLMVRAQSPISFFIKLFDYTPIQPIRTRCMASNSQ